MTNNTSLSNVNQQQQQQQQHLQSNTNNSLSLPTSSTVVTAATASSFSLGSGAYFYDNSPTAAAVAGTVPSGYSNQQVNRGGSFNNQQTGNLSSNFVPSINPQQQPSIRSVGTPVHGKYLTT